MTNESIIKMNKKKERIHAKLICEKIVGIKIVGYNYYLDNDTKYISKILSSKCDKRQPVKIINMDSKVYDSIFNVFNELKIGNNVIFSVGCGWLCRAEVIDWKDVIMSLLNLVGICFYDYDIKKGVSIELDEYKYGYKCKIYLL